MVFVTGFTAIALAPGAVGIDAVTACARAPVAPAARRPTASTETAAQVSPLEFIWSRDIRFAISCMEGIECILLVFLVIFESRVIWWGWTWARLRLDRQLA